MLGSPVWYPTVNHFCRCAAEPCVQVSGLVRPVVCCWIRSSPTPPRPRGRLDVLVAQRLQVRHTGALLLDGGRVVCPHPGVAVRLQLRAHATARSTLRTLLSAAEHPQQVLHVMAVFMGHHILFREWAATGTELGDQHLEEVGVEVGRFVHWAVERPDLAAGRSASGAYLAAEQPHVWAGVAGQQRFPYRVHGVTGGHHPALHEPVGIGPGSALAQVETGCYVVAGVERLLAQHATGIDAEQHCDHHHQ